MPDPTSWKDDDATPPQENVATRSELTAEEQAVGSDDPMAQARAILSESEDRIEAASDDSSRDVAGVERRTSDETVDPRQE